MPFFQDESETHLKHGANSTSSTFHSADYQWNSASAQGFVTAVLSTILYARESLPDDCFQAVPSWAWDWKISHNHLFRAGAPLSHRAKDRVLGQKEPRVYLRASGNHRLHHFVDALVTRIFPAIEQKRLGKILICFSRSKTNDTGALVEFYSLKFRYTEMGSMYTHISWGGPSSVPIPICENPFMEFLRTRVPFDCVFYTHLSVYSIDGRPLDAWQSHNRSHRVSEAISDLQCKEETMIRRIGTLVYHSRTNPIPEGESRFYNEEQPRPLHNPDRNIDTEDEASTLRQSQTMRQDISACPSQWLSPAWIEETPSSLFDSDCGAHIFEETSDNLPSTQPVLSEHNTHMATMGVGSSQLPRSRRPLSLFVDQKSDLDELSAEVVTIGALRKDHTPDSASSSIDCPSQLPASPIEPTS